MPQTVQIPDGTMLEFPDGMSHDDMAKAIYSNFPHLNPDSKEGFESEEVVSSEVSRADKRAALAKQMEGERRKGMFAQSLANVAGAAESAAYSLAHPIETTEKGIEAAATLMTGSPKELMVKPSEIMRRPLVKIPEIPKQEGEAAQVAAGIGNAVIGFANFLQTPEGVGMLGIAGLPEGLRRGVTMAISAQMAQHAPEGFNKAIEAANAGDVQGVAQHTTEFLGGTALAALAAGHSLQSKGVVEKLQTANAPLTAEAVKQTEAGKAEMPKDAIPTVDIEKAPVVPAESVGLQPAPKPLEPKVEPSAKPTAESLLTELDQIWMMWDRPEFDAFLKDWNKQFAETNPSLEQKRIAFEKQTHQRKLIGDDYIQENLKDITPDTRAVKMVDRKDPTKYWLVTPSVRESGKWQATRFDAQGPAMDTTFSSLENAVRSLSGQYLDSKTYGRDAGPPYASSGELRTEIVRQPQPKPVETKAPVPETKPVVEATEAPKVETPKPKSAVPQVPLTPLQKRYFERKTQMPEGEMLAMRFGDFYEVFGADAKRAKDAVGGVVTKRNNVEMWGFPFHAADQTIRKLAEKGIKVVVDEGEKQLKETPKPVEAPKEPVKQKVEEPVAADIEGMLTVEIPNVAEARARVQVADRAQAELRDRAKVLEREIKEIEKIIKPQRGSTYTRSKIKASAPKAQVARYHELQKEWRKVGDDIHALDESVRKDRQAVDAEADAKIISDKSQPLLRRLDRQARRLEPKVPKALQQALDAELKRVILEKYPDATPAEIARLAPDVRSLAYHQADPWKALGAPKLEDIRRAELDAAMKDIEGGRAELSPELEAELDRYRKGGRRYGGPISPDAPVEPLSGAKLVELKERIKSDAEAWRKRNEEQIAKEKAEEDARKAEEAKLIAEAQEVVAKAKRVGTVGGRSAKEVKEELIERIEEKMEALVKESGVTIRKGEEKGGVTDYVATGEGDHPGALAEVSRSGSKYRVNVRLVGDAKNAISRTVDSLAEAELLIKAMGSRGKGHVIIAVPGDGIFRIRNEGAALLKVWNDANRLVTSSGGSPAISRSGSAEKPPSGIKTEGDWHDAKSYHGLEPLDEISSWSPALAELAKKVNPDAPEKVTTHDVESFIKRKKEERKPAAEKEPEEQARTATTEDPFERARRGEEKAFDDLDAQFREVWPDPPEFEARPGSAQVFTPEAFKRLFDDAFKARDFDRIVDAIKATSDVTIWKPYLKELFAAQAKDAIAAKKAEWFRAVFNGTRPADALPPKPKPAPSAPPPRPSTGTRGPSTGSTPPPPPPPAPPPARIAVEPITGGGAKSPFRIIADFESALGKAIRVRRMRSGTLGTYKPGSTEAARRFASDLDTTAHELAGHWVDDKFGIGKPWVQAKTRSPYDAELAKFWIHGSVTPRSTLRYRRAEGIAEYIRAYIVNPAEAMREAPTFTAYFEKTIPPKALNAIRHFSNDVRTWAGEEPLTRAGLNIRMEPETLRERLWNAIRGRGFGFEVSPMDRLRLWFDDPYRFAVKAFGEAAEMRGGLPVKPEHNFELLSRLLATHDARMTDQFDFGLVPLKPNQVKVKNAKGKLEVERATDPVTKEPMTLEWLLKPFDQSNRKAFDKDMRDASAYMVAERTIEKAKELGRKDNVSGIGAGIFSDVEAAKAALASAAKNPALEGRLKEAARRYRLWADHNLQMLVDAGRLSKEQAKEIRDRNEFYVDMHRLSIEFEAANRQQRGVRIGTARDVMKRFKGSSLELDNVYSNLLEQTDSIQKEAHRNMTMRAYTDMLDNVRKMHGPDLKEFEIFGSKAKAEDRNTIQVWEDGKGQHWKFAPEIHESLKGLGELGTHALIDLVSLPSQFARYMITHSPQFMSRNPVRDSIQRSVVSRNASTPWDVLKGYTKEDLSRFKIFGGGQFGNYIVDRHTWNRVLKDVSRELVKDPRNILVSPLKLKHAWENLAQASENLGRVAEFRRAFEKGKNELGYDDYNAALYAAGEARGLLDFAKAGTVMRVINRLVPFSNARLRGLIRAVESAKENPKGFALRWSMYVVLPTLLTWLWNRKDEETWDEYQQQPAYLRDFFWSFKVGDYWLRIPKPHELGVMASGVERALSRATGEKHALDGYGKNVAQSALPIGDPVEATGPLKTFLELEFNRDTLRDRDIVPAHEKDLKLELRKGKEHASGAGKGLAAMLNAAGMEVDPRQMDHLLQSYGGAGQIVTSATGNRERPFLDTAIKGTGYFVEPPAANARDVQWVIDWAKKNGQMNAIKQLTEVRKAVLDEKDPKARAEKAKFLREMATQMREQIEAMEATP